MASHGTMLELSGISKHYGGISALLGIDLAVGRGEAHCLIGENGSGKSTLIRIISGATAPDPGGRIRIDGRDFEALHPAASIACGVQVIYQDHALFPHLTVAENIAFGARRGRTIPFVSRSAMRQRAEEIAERLRVDLDVRRRVEDLPVSTRQIVAICRAIAAEGRFLIMDEPTASLTSREVAALFDVVDGLRRDGVSILFVSHRLHEVRHLAERVSVLRDGRMVASAKAGDLDDASLSRLMTGKEFSYAPRPPVMAGREILRVENLGRDGEFEDVSFTVGAGEVVGILGSLGAGRTELALALFGVTRPSRGRMSLGGKPYRPASNRDAIAAGVCYLPEDRLTTGLVLPQSIRRNITISVLDRFLDRFGFVDRGRLDGMVRDLVERLAIKVTDLDAPVRTLSGGNQQRVAIARLVATRPDLLILDSPTVGVDVGAKDAIYGIVHALATEGLGVVIISDEETEVLHHCHRILTMREGRITGEHAPMTTSEAELRQVIHG